VEDSLAIQKRTNGSCNKERYEEIEHSLLLKLLVCSLVIAFDDFLQSTFVIHLTL